MRWPELRLQIYHQKRARCNGLWWWRHFSRRKLNWTERIWGDEISPCGFPPCGFAGGHIYIYNMSTPGPPRLRPARPSPLGRRRSSSSLLSTPTFSDASVLRSQQRAPKPAACSDAIVLRRHRSCSDAAAPPLDAAALFGPLAPPHARPHPPAPLAQHAFGMTVVCTHVMRRLLCVCPPAAQRKDILLAQADGLRSRIFFVFTTEVLGRTVGPPGRGTMIQLYTFELFRLSSIFSPKKIPFLGTVRDSGRSVGFLKIGLKLSSKPVTGFL